MNSCEMIFLLYKLKELMCKKCCEPSCKCEVNNFISGGCKDDDCDVCICGCDCDCDCDCCSCKKQDSICDCCVDPLEFLLSQLQIGDVLTVFTDDTVVEFPDASFPGTFLCVKDSILSILSEDGNGTVGKFPLCHIAKIESDEFNPYTSSLELEEAPKRPRKGGCECCEEPIRRCLQCACGLTAVIGIEGGNDGRFQILRVGEGVVIALNLDNNKYTAIPICKITLVEMGGSH